jgi:hypothetical protein
VIGEPGVGPLRGVESAVTAGEYEWTPFPEKSETISVTTLGPAFENVTVTGTPVASSLKSTVTVNWLSLYVPSLSARSGKRAGHTKPALTAGVPTIGSARAAAANTHATASRVQDSRFESR